MDEEVNLNGKIPHVIYFVWDRGKKVSELARCCIASWHRFFPDYRIRMIGLEECPLDESQLASFAYAEKKFTYAADFMRLKYLYEHGGVYFDLDVEVIRDMRDLVERGTFFGIERGSNVINTGVGFAVTPHHPLLRDLLAPYYEWNGNDLYDERGFVKLPTNTMMNDPVFRRWGYDGKDHLQVHSGVTYYPTDYLCPLHLETREMTIGEQTRSIHHHVSSDSNEIDRWFWEEYARFKRAGLSHKNTMARLFMLHPVRTSKYRFLHRKRTVLLDGVAEANPFYIIASSVCLLAVSIQSVLSFWTILKAKEVGTLGLSLVLFLVFSIGFVFSSFGCAKRKLVDLIWLCGIAVVTVVSIPVLLLLDASPWEIASIVTCSFVSSSLLPLSCRVISLGAVHGES